MSSFNSNGTGIQSNTSLASGWYSTALGYDSTADGDNSVAMINEQQQMEHNWHWDLIHLLKAGGQ